MKNYLFIKQQWGHKMIRIVALIVALVLSSCATQRSSTTECSLFAYSFCIALPEGVRLFSEEGVTDFVVYNLIREEDASGIYVFEGSGPESFRVLKLLESRKSRKGEIEFKISILSDDSENVFALLLRDDIDLPVTIQIDKYSSRSNLLDLQTILAGLIGCKDVQMFGARCRGDGRQ